MNNNFNSDKIITDTKSGPVQFIQSLTKKKSRDEHRCFLLEGLRAVLEALEEKDFVREVVISQSFKATEEYSRVLSLVQKNKVRVTYVSDKVFALISDTKTPQGIGCVCHYLEPKRVRISDDIAEIDKDVKNILLLEDVRDPGNLGTMIRTAAAAGFDAIILLEGCVDIYNSKVTRSTVGCMFHIDLIQNLPNTKAVVDALKKAGFTLYAAHPRGGSCAIGEKFSQKNVIVIGNEANGITTAMLHHCDKLLTIPMPGGTESLNASVAAALMIYEVIRN